MFISDSIFASMNSRKKRLSLVDPTGADKSANEDREVCGFLDRIVHGEPPA
jgi:hypothetical protein